MLFNDRISVVGVNVIVLMILLGKGFCDSTCPDGIVNITGVTSGELVYPSSGSYGINETKCWRIEVPKPYQGIGIYRHSLDIEECGGCTCDSLVLNRHYRYLKFVQGQCGRETPKYDEYVLQLRRKEPQNTMIGENIYIRFVSDDTVHLKGFNISYIVKSNSYGKASYLNTSTDETIEFGTPKVGIKNYPADFAWQWFLIVPEGRQVKITFEIFELEQSENCKNDYVEVREAYVSISREIEGEYGAILARHMCGSTKPAPIQSSGNMVWVQFKSDSNTTTTYKGFKASFTSKGQRKLPSRNPLALLLISALLMVKKITLF